MDIKKNKHENKRIKNILFYFLFFVIKLKTHLFYFTYFSFFVLFYFIHNFDSNYFSFCISVTVLAWLHCRCFSMLLVANARFCSILIQIFTFSIFQLITTSSRYDINSQKRILSNVMCQPIHLPIFKFTITLIWLN